MNIETFELNFKKEKVIFLSHELNSRTPSYGNKGGFLCKKISSIEEGSSANSSYWEFNNHLGTHIDFPYHFNTEAKTLSDYNASFFWVKKTVLVILDNVEPGEIVNVHHFKGKIFYDDKVEALLLRTGFEKFRQEDCYWENSPGYHSDLYSLFKTTYPNLRYFGFDSISLTSIKNREMGKAAHLKFLLANDPIIIIEDMFLSGLTEEDNISEMIISPLPVSNADGSPVTIYCKIV